MYLFIYDDTKFVKELLDACSNKQKKYNFEDYVVEKGRGLETSLTSLANVVGQSTSVRLPTWGQAHLRIRTWDFSMSSTNKTG